MVNVLFNTSADKLVAFPLLPVGLLTSEKVTIRLQMSVYVEKSQEDMCRGFPPSPTNAKLSNMALLHLFSIYRSPLSGLGIAGADFSAAYEQLDQI